MVEQEEQRSIRESLEVDRHTQDTAGSTGSVLTARETVEASLENDSCEEISCLSWDEFLPPTDSESS